MGFYTPKRNTGMETEITHQKRCGLGDRCCGSKYATRVLFSSRYPTFRVSLLSSSIVPHRIHRLVVGEVEVVVV